MNWWNRFLCRLLGHEWRMYHQDDLPSSRRPGVNPGMGGGFPLSVRCAYDCARCGEEKEEFLPWD